jgi:hypothetical protein
MLRFSRQTYAMRKKGKNTEKKKDKLMRHGGKKKIKKQIKKTKTANKRSK